MTSVAKQDFIDPKLDGKTLDKNKFDNKQLRQSHFTLGDKSQNPLEQYATTYGNTMIPKQLDPKEYNQTNSNHVNSLNLKGEGPTNYVSETKAK